MRGGMRRWYIEGFCYSFLWAVLAVVSYYDDMRFLSGVAVGLCIATMAIMGRERIVHS